MAKSAPGWLVCAEAPPMVNDCAALSPARASTKQTGAAYRPSRKIVVLVTIYDLYPRAPSPALVYGRPRGRALQPVSGRSATRRTLLARQSERATRRMSLVLRVSGTRNSARLHVR